MPYTLDGVEKFYDLGKDHNAKAFFDALRDGQTAITSALNPADYTEYFEPFFKAGEDIFYISFSSEMSGTFKYMDTAVKELKEKYPKASFTRYDTKGISLAAGVPVWAAAKAFAEGKTVNEVIRLLDSLCPRMNALLVADDLNYLKRGGRLSSAQAFFGSILKIKPIIKLTNKGTLEVFEKVSGANKAYLQITQELVASVSDLDDYPVCILTADNDEAREILVEELRELLPKANLWVYDVGPVIGTHCGPGTVAVVFVGDERPRATV